MADLIVDIPDDAGTTPGQEESVARIPHLAHVFYQEHIQGREIVGDQWRRSWGSLKRNTSIRGHYVNCRYSPVNSSKSTNSSVSALDLQMEPLMDKHSRRGIHPEPVPDEASFESSSMAIFIPGLATTPESSRPGTPIKWYFNMAARQPVELHNYSMVNVEQEPLSVHASCQRINWNLLDRDMSEGLYDITLGLSIKGLVLETVESISITVVKQSHSEPTEIITSNDLRNMKTNPRIPKVNGVIRLKLHQQVLKSSKEESKGDIKFVMDIRTLPDAKVDSGSIVMYYMEACRNVFGDDISVSGDGFHVVTLATMATPTTLGPRAPRATQQTQAGSLVMEVWDVRNHSSTNGNISCTKKIIGTSSNGLLNVAVSWNASMIALLDISPVRVARHTKQDISSMFRVFTHRANININQHSQPTSRCTLKNVDSRPDLKAYIGNGRFHFTSNPGVELDKELFIACDGKALNLYNPFKQWSHIRRIPLDEEFSLGYYDLGTALSKHLRGRHLALASRSKQHIAVWNIEQGAVVSFMDRQTANTFALSFDGLLMAFVRRQHISLHSTTTGTMIGACRLEELTSKHIVSSVSFIEGDKRIMVETNYKDPNLGPQHLGFIIDTTTLVVEDRYFLPPKVFSHHSSVDSERLVCLHHYTLGLIHLNDRIVSTPASLQRTRCNSHCTAKWSTLTILPTALLVPLSGLHFKAQKLPASASSPASVAITASKNGSPSDEKLIFQVPGNYDIAAFLPSHSCLVVQRSSLLMIWKLPRTISGNHQLILVHNLGADQVWRVCREQRIFSHGPHPKTSERNVYLDIEHPFTLDNSECFMGGMAALVLQFADANEAYRSHIFQYLGRHINTYPDQQDTLTSVLGHIYSAWSSDAHALYCSFLKALLYSPSTRRIPRPDLEKTLNPLLIFLDLSKKNPQAIALAEIIIDYCIDTAKVNRDPSFLAPVSRSLATLVERKGPHSELALKTLRGFAYVPVSHRSYLIEHHIISYPPIECWKFWTRERTKLFYTPDPILQLSTLPTEDPSSANFTRELYAANYDLLWKLRQGADKSVLFLAKPIQGQNHYSWPIFLFHTIAQKFGVTGNLSVECHPFDLKELDNPAIAALIDYKWNTIGYRYWLVRFLGQCCYYVLVLVAVFKQVYGDHTETLRGLLSPPTFRRYNYADLLAFLTPMFGSIYQLLIISGHVSGDTNLGFLSYSVLFICLHMLFELRVAKSVCHFVTIIIQVIKTIRVFFFIFAAGPLGFTIAMLHLLRGCVNSSCSNLSEDFPTNFLEAISAVYFVMGGRYDPFDNDFKSGGFAFHFMLVVFFFFTAILMLNVLIALINLAFNDGDQTWRLTWLENRMRYVESAENMTYINPAFRETQSCFPSTVFYSATPQQVRSYDRETKQLIEDSAPTVARPDGASKGGGGDDDNTSMQLHFEQKLATDELRSELKCGLKEELRFLRNENALLRVQVSELQEQFTTLPAQIAALLKADETQPGRARRPS
ncbi:hypothetical protein BKA57DRAFT_499737 [Linnemannia elongata]|nr:hypothetical protein BKA57DRAFT_499737 [Linnemannia elongata]